MTLPLRIELAMTLKAVFPDVWPSAGPDRGVLRAAKAVSGCNILICRPDASLLRLIPASPNGQYRYLSTSRGASRGERDNLRFRSSERRRKPNDIKAIGVFSEFPDRYAKAVS